jgi:hypothetical protein
VGTVITDNFINYIVLEESKETLKVLVQEKKSTTEKKKFLNEIEPF